MAIIDLLSISEVSVFGDFWSVFSRNRTEYGPENLRIRTLFTQ